MSNEQVEKVKVELATDDRRRRQASAAAKEKRSGMTEFFEQLETLNKRTASYVFSVLSAEQREQFELMKGREFHLGIAPGGPLPQARQTHSSR